MIYILHKTDTAAISLAAFRHQKLSNLYSVWYPQFAGPLASS